MARRTLTAAAPAAVVALALSAFSFYAALQWNLGIYFATAGYVLGQGTRLSVAKARLAREPDRRLSRWEAVAMLAVALSLVGGLLLSPLVNLILGSLDEVGPVRYRLNNAFAISLLALAILGRWRLGPLVGRLKAKGEEPR